MAQEGTRDPSGRFLPGHPGGPGRKARSTPLHREITQERAQELWRERHVIATTDTDNERRDRAAEYILRYHTGQPAVQQPDVPAIAWGKIRSIEDVRGAVTQIFELHEQGEIDATGLHFLMGILERAAKLFETIDVQPQIEALRELVLTIRETVPMPAGRG